VIGISGAVTRAPDPAGPCRFAAFLLKPIDPNELLRVLEQVLLPGRAAQDRSPTEVTPYGWVGERKPWLGTEAAMANETDPATKTELEQCRAVIAALSESVRTLTASLETARAEAESARALAAARAKESGERDLAIAALFDRIDALEQTLRAGRSTRLRAV
jgi:hypothetical protein